MDSEAIKGRGYDIQEKIGAGGFGVVYRASQPSVGRDVAIKVVLPHIARDPLFIQRFEQEAKLAAQLEHPNIVPLYDYWQDETQAYLVMRWLRGGSLHELLKNGPLDAETAVRLTTQIASALETAHEKGVVHRDLKPSNVLMDEKGNAYLSDFGIAKHLVGTTIGTPTGAIIGSPAYMAPEQITSGEVTAQSDLYSLGIMLFEMVTGETPFGDMEPVAMLYNQVNEPVPLACSINLELPSEVDQVIQKATDKDQAVRYPDAASMSVAFQRALDPISFQLGLDGEEGQLHNLPAQSTPFIGREDEVAALCDFLDDPQTRLLTIIGPGGMGKTRLALATAETQVGHFLHGVYFVPLAPVDTVEDVALAIGRAIGFSFPGRADPTEELANFLRRRTMLLVLDNFEHLLDGASVVTTIIQAAPGLQIIVTTRERLQLHDEQLIPLSGLSFPSWETLEDAAEYAAVQLFMQSARRVRPDFELVHEDLEPLARICRLSQGMPLAILLAAGWIELLSPAEIAEELSHNLDILETAIRDRPARQRSMRTVFNYTWAHLNRKEQILLQNLSVFRGGCSIRAAREITSVSLLLLRSLVNKSLLQPTSGDRYEVHELLRQFAAEKLADDPDEDNTIHNAHSAYYLTAVADRKEALFSDRFLDTMAEIDIDLENVRAAWRWAVENRRVELLEQAVICLFNYHNWQKNVQYQFKDAQLVVDHFLESKIPRERFVMAWALLFQGIDLPNNEDMQLVQRGLSILREPSLVHMDIRAAMAYGLQRWGGMESLSDTDKSRELLGESLIVYESIGDRRGLAEVLLEKSYNTGRDGDFGEAERLARLSFAIREELGNPLEQVESLWSVTFFVANQGRIEEGLQLGRQCLALNYILGGRYRVLGLHSFADLSRVSGQYVEACRRYKEVKVAFEEIGDLINLLRTISWHALAGLHIGKYRQFLSIVDEQREIYTSRYFLGQLELGYCCALLGLGRPDEALEESRRAVESFRLGGLQPDLSRALATLALVLRAVGDADSARERFTEAIQLAIEMRSPPVLMYSLPSAALLLTDGGDNDQAVAVYSLAMQNPIVANSQWFYDVAGKEIETIAGSLPPDDAEAARARGAGMDLWKTAEELLNEFKSTPQDD
jgi:predicted ATPase